MEQGSTTSEAADTGLFAGDAWFDPIEAGIRERVRGWECQKHGALRRELDCWMAEASVQHRGPDLKHTMSAAG